MSEESEVARLTRERDEARAEVVACLEFLETEMGWDYFREEQLYFDDEPKRNQSANNARLLKNYLTEKNHGIRLLRELHQLREGKTG